LDSYRQTIEARYCLTMSCTTLRCARLFKPRAFQMTRWFALMERGGATTAAVPQASLAAVRVQWAPRMGRSSRMASLLEEETEPAKVLWNLVAIVASGVLWVLSSGFWFHLFSRTRRACLSGCGS
jgi:hypothetical protein